MSEAETLAAAASALASPPPMGPISEVQLAWLAVLVLAALALAVLKWMEDEE